MTVIVTAVFYPKPGKKQELAEAMRRGIEAVHTEDGCELYAIHDAEDGTITMIEKLVQRRGAGHPRRQRAGQDPPRRRRRPRREARPGHPHDPAPPRHGGPGPALSRSPTAASFR